MPSSKDTLKTPWRQPLNSSNWRENSPTPPPPMSTPTLAPLATPCRYTQATFPISPATLTLFENPGNCTCQVVPIVPLIDSDLSSDEECNSIQNLCEWKGQKMKFWVCRQKPQARPFNRKRFQKYVCMVLVQKIKFRFDWNFGLGSSGGRMTGFS